MTVYSETCINRSCSKAETLLRRTDTFDPVCFLYASLSHISKVETVKRTLLQTDNFFQSSDKNMICLTRTKVKVLEISEKQRINLDIFCQFSQKETPFLYFKTVFFFDFILQFLKESDTSEYNTAYWISFQTIFVDINRLEYAPLFC